MDNGKPFGKKENSNGNKQSCCDCGPKQPNEDSGKNQNTGLNSRTKNGNKNEIAQKPHHQGSSGKEAGQDNRCSHRNHKHRNGTLTENYK